MSLNEIRTKTEKNLLNLYEEFQNRGAFMPTQKNMDNLLECAKSMSKITYITVSFDTGTGETIPSQTIVYGHPIEIPTPTITPEEDQIFDCWLWNNVPVTSSTPITESCTLTPRWAGKVYLMAGNVGYYNVIGYDRANLSLTRANCRSITFLNDGSIPEDAVTSWDVSLNRDGSVMAYVDTNNTSDTYNLYISGNGKMFLPADSTRWFYNYGNGATITFNNLDVLDTSNVTNMTRMFEAIGTTDMIDVSTFNTENVTNMSYMFNACKTVGAINVVGFNTKKVTNFSYMFYQCRLLTSLNLSTFEIDSTSSGSWTYIWCNCNALRELDVRNMDFTGKSTASGNMTDNYTMRANCKVYCKNSASKTWLTTNASFTASNITIV